MKSFVPAVAIASLLSASAASAGSGGATIPAGFQLEGDDHQIMVQMVDPVIQESTRGGVLPLVLGIVGVDLALMGFYWGVYVPYYASVEPAGNYSIR